MAENRVDLYATPLVTGAPTVGQPVTTQYQWQRAVIVRHLGQSQYLVRLRHNNSIVLARIGWLEERIAKLLPEIAGRRQYLAVWLAVVRHYEQQVRNDLKLLIAIGSKEFRDQRKLVEAAEKAFRTRIPYSYAEFRGRRHETGTLGDDLIWEANIAAELVPNEEGIRAIPLAAIDAFHTALDNLTAAGCWEFVPGDPCQDGGGGGDPLDESPFLSGLGSGWPEESPPVVDESGESGDGTGGGNRKAEAIAAARDLLASFPTVEQCMDRLRVSQKDLAEAGAWYSAAKADLAVWVFDLAEAQGEKKLLTDKGVLAEVEVPAWTMLWCPGLSEGLRVWVSWPCGDPSRGYPVLRTNEQTQGTDADAGEALYGTCGGQPQSPMAMGLAGSVLAYALSPAWQRHWFLGPWPATVLSVDEEAGTASIRLISTHAANNPDIIARHPVQVDNLPLPGPAKAWRSGDTAAVYRPRIWSGGRFVVVDQWSILGWMHHPKTIRGEAYLTRVQSDQCCIWRGGDPAQLAHLWWYVQATALVPEVGWELPHVFYDTFAAPFDAPECHTEVPGEYAQPWDFYEIASTRDTTTLSLVSLCVRGVTGAGNGWVANEYRQVVLTADRGYRWLGLFVHYGYDLENDHGHLEGIREWIAAKKAEPGVSYVWKLGSLFMTQGRRESRYPPD